MWGGTQGCLVRSLGWSGLREARLEAEFRLGSGQEGAGTVCAEFAGKAGGWEVFHFAICIPEAPLKHLRGWRGLNQAGRQTGASQESQTQAEWMEGEAGDRGAGRWGSVGGADH